MVVYTCIYIYIYISLSGPVAVVIVVMVTVVMCCGVPGDVGRGRNEVASGNIVLWMLFVLVDDVLYGLSRQHQIISFCG